MNKPRGKRKELVAMTTLASFSRQLRRRVRRTLCVSSCLHSEKLKAGTLLTSNGAGGTIGTLLSKILDRRNSISLSLFPFSSFVFLFVLRLCELCQDAFVQRKLWRKTRKVWLREDKTQLILFRARQESERQRHTPTHPKTPQTRETL